MLFLWFLSLTCFNPIQAQQYYDSSDCSADTSYPGSRYICNSSQKPCSTFLVYRANQHFKTISNISHLLKVNVRVLLDLNSPSSASGILEPGREVLVPVTCSCIDDFFQVDFSYGVPENTTLSEVACALFEGLVKSHTLVEENMSRENDVKVGSELHVPLKCACPNNFSSSNGIMYLVTYPLIEGDTLSLHYLHYCIFPSCAHMGVSSRNIFVTANWKAKLTYIRTNSAAESLIKGNDNVDIDKGWVAPEYILYGSDSDKEGELVKVVVFEQLRSFMDPFLKQDYPLAEALCLAVLAKACVEDDPLHRPSMDDILKVLVRLL
ncbi:hypothetical protein GH714_028617 [Hevea brasiliensis]|uniref:LysM domain-containing protein n=1 Tax=Hevea brasiliensis TaxID=3981 RepID=A0A6A6K762_HEVBR|nr:hypothetical protein GH714_028617 [Hevea brasiliensis]